MVLFPNHMTPHMDVNIILKTLVSTKVILLFLFVQ